MNRSNESQLQWCCQSLKIEINPGVCVLKYIIAMINKFVENKSIILVKAADKISQLRFFFQGRHPHNNKSLMRFLFPGWDGVGCPFKYIRILLAVTEDIKCNPLMTVRPGLARILLWGGSIQQILLVSICLLLLSQQTELNDKGPESSLIPLSPSLFVSLSLKLTATSWSAITSGCGKKPINVPLGAMWCTFYCLPHRLILISF